MSIVRARAAINDDPRPLPGENPASNPRAVIGGNVPPIEERIPAEFREAMLTERADIFKKLDDLLGVPAVIDPATGEEIKPAIEGSVHRAKCEDDEQMGKCGILVNALREAGNVAKRAKEIVKRPYWDAGKAVDAEYNAIDARIDAGINAVVALQKAHQREKDRLAEVARQEAIEEQRKADAARAELEALAKENGLEAALPPQPQPNDPAFFARVKSEPIRTDGATVSTGKEWLVDSVDVVKAIRHCKTNTKVVEAVKAAMKALVKSTDNNAGKGFAGVDARQDVKVSNR